MRKIFVIGIGVGDPDHMTMQAIKALNQVDVFFIPDKGAEKAALRDLRISICERFIENAGYRTVAVDVPQRETSGDYLGGVDAMAWPACRYLWQICSSASLTRTKSAPCWCGAIPRSTTARCGSSNGCAPSGLALDFEVIPGISSVQVLAARHRIALNRIGESVLLTTGRKLAEGFPDDAGSVVVLLDGVQAFANARRPGP